MGYRTPQRGVECRISGRGWVSIEGFPDFRARTIKCIDKNVDIESKLEVDSTQFKSDDQIDLDEGEIIKTDVEVPDERQ